MSSAELPKEIIQERIRIPSDPPIKEKLDKLTGRIDHPDELDEVTKDLGAPAYLLNFHCATPMDLSPIGLGEAVHIPVQISQREGGRKSIFYLDQGEEALVGILVTNQGIALRFMKRETGNSPRAQKGDIYSTRITSREGEPIFEGKGELDEIDPSPNPSPASSVAVASGKEGEIIADASPNPLPASLANRAYFRNAGPTKPSGSYNPEWNCYTPSHSIIWYYH
ncbi:MAG TPA: hypothetical protein VFA10_30610 [Ktedonobacteraceae bacterium]|nr:hypothetical protein [Ktedonobacteraceae bacterium]